MLNVLSDYLRQKAQSLDYVSKAYGIAEKAFRDDNGTNVSFPIVNGEQIIFDTEPFLVFFMLDGDVSRNTQESETVACEDDVIETYRIKAYLFVSGKEPSDCASFTQRSAYALAKYITGDNSTLENSQNLEEVDITTSSFVFNKRDVWDDLHDGIPFGLSDSRQLASITFNVELTGRESCFVDYDCPDNPITNFCEVTITINGTTVGTFAGGETSNIEVVNQDGDATGSLVAGQWVVTTSNGGGTINVYLDGVLQSSTVSSDLDAEIVNILWT